MVVVLVCSTVTMTQIRRSVGCIWLCLKGTHNSVILSHLGHLGGHRGLLVSTFGI